MGGRAAHAFARHGAIFFCLVGCLLFVVAAIFSFLPDLGTKKKKKTGQDSLRCRTRLAERAAERRARQCTRNALAERARRGAVARAGRRAHQRCQVCFWFLSSACFFFV